MNAKFTLEIKEWCVKRAQEITREEVISECFRKFGVKPDKSSISRWTNKSKKGTLSSEGSKFTVVDVKKREELKTYCANHKKSGRTYKDS